MKILVTKNDWINFFQITNFFMWQIEVQIDFCFTGERTFDRITLTIVNYKSVEYFSAASNAKYTMVAF